MNINPLDDLIGHFSIVKYAIGNNDIFQTIFKLMIDVALDELFEFHGQWFLNFDKIKITTPNGDEIFGIPLENYYLIKYIGKHRLPAIEIFSETVCIFAQNDYNVFYCHSVDDKMEEMILCTCDCFIPDDDEYMIDMGLSRLSFDDDNNTIVDNFNKLDTYVYNKSKMCGACLHYAKKGIRLCGHNKIIPIKFVDNKWVYNG